jgi:hypothetical protein
MSVAPIKAPFAAFVRVNFHLPQARQLVYNSKLALRAEPGLYSALASGYIQSRRKSYAAPEEGMKTILEDLGRTLPDAHKLQPSTLIDASVVREAAKGF